jgi:hypothetical protein
MRVVNDKNESSSRPQPLNLLALPLYALLCAIGFSSVFMSPLAVILTHRRLPEFWPKVVSITGAVVALLVLEVPLPVVLISFVFGVFVADSVQREVPFWLLAIRSVALSAVLGGLGLAFVSQLHSQSNLLEGWRNLVGLAVTQAQQGGFFGPELDWEMMRKSLFYEGPFFYLAASLLSLWLSVGLSAHLGWQAEETVYGAKKLRALRLPAWLSVATVVLWVLDLVLANRAAYVIAGFLDLLVAVFFIQGCVTLSVFLNQKRFARGTRAVIYSLFIVFGFYALVGLGLMSPLIFLKKRRTANLQNRPIEEAV